MPPEHTYCLNCGGAFGQHNPDDPNSCADWHPSTLKEADDAA